MDSPSCDVLLATYNAGPYLEPLLESLLQQTYTKYRLLVSDDGSTDKTRETIRSYEHRFGGRLAVLPDGAPTGSAKQNFSRLMEASDADYVLFADQDDVWLKDKVEHTIEILASAEEAYARATPVYAFTDVTPTDANLRPLSNSYWKFKKINPKTGVTLPQALVCPPMLGCASGINRALANIATPVDPLATGHDWWCLLIAAACGRVVYSDRQTMFYRLHGGNSSAQKKVSIVDYALSRHKFEKVRRGMRLRFLQATSVLNRLEQIGLSDGCDVVAAFIDIEKRGFIMRRLLLVSGGYTYPDASRNLAMLLAS